jgi:predicted transcriptional regulator
MDWPVTLHQIEDHLCPRLKLDAWEKSLYYHLLRLTHAAGLESVTVAIGPLALATGMSDFKVRDSIRSLHVKKCISIVERSRTGHLVSVHLPQAIEGVVPISSKEVPLDIELVDFYRDRVYLRALLERENRKCFYTLKDLTEDSAVLDHVIPQVDGGNNSYRNIVAACHDANALKQGQVAEDFIRSLYRSGILNLDEMEGRLRAVEALKSGKLIPVIR